MTTSNDSSKNNKNKNKNNQSSKKRLMRLRSQMARKRPKFRRQKYHKLKRIQTTYRRPKGIDSAMRHKRNGYLPIVNKGYRGPKAVRGLHPSGYKINYIANLNDLGKVNLEEEVAMIRGTVGTRKRIAIIDRAKELNIHILNPMLRVRGIEAEEFEDLEDLDDEFGLLSDEEFEILDEEEFEFFDDDDFDFELDDETEEE